MLVGMGDSPELFKFVNTGRHLKSAPKEGGNQLPGGTYFCMERVGHGLKHCHVLTLLEQSQLIHYLENATGDRANVKGRLFCPSLNTHWPEAAHRQHQAHWDL